MRVLLRSISLDILVLDPKISADELKDKAPTMDKAVNRIQEANVRTMFAEAMFANGNLH